MASTITGQDGACTILNEAKAPVSTIACLTPGITSPAASSSVTEIQAAPPPPSSPAGGQSNLLAPVSTPNLSASVTAASTSGHNGTPIPSQSTQAIVKNGGLASGAVAGVAIGMLFAGVLIAGAVFFFLLRHQKRRQASHSPINHLAPSGYESRPEKGPVTVSRSVSNNISDLVPQPASDDNIKNNVSKIRDNIKNHVRTYCHSAPITSGVNEAALRNVASATSLSTGALVGALSNPSSRQDALRLIVAWIILSKTTSGKSSELLPSQLSGLSAAVARTADNPTQAVLYSKWKTITGALLQQQLGKDAHDLERAQVFANIIAELDSFLVPFIQGSADGDQRRKNLEMILSRSADFAFLLFSQPGSFQFDFASQRGGLVSFPALLQTVGDEGEAFNPPRRLFEADIVSVH